ncbi:MAG TPA: Tol-Pal system beta propeller repeat protein TolB [Anaeromyxobacteraceae bacterium]
MRRSLAALLLSLPLAAASQRLVVDVTSPNFRPLPIAVPAFRADAAAAGAARDMTETLRGDLQLTGIFDLLDPRSFLAPPDEGQTAPFIRFGRWIDVGAEGLVKAQVRAGADLAAELRLFEVRAGREVLSQTYRGPPAAGRRLAHRFADDIVRHYTREPGVFQTRIAAFRRAASGRELVVFDVDGGNAEVVWRDTVALLPAWRPDGNAILFTSYRSGRPDLWELDLRTRQGRRLVSLGDLATGGAYSPDGRRIAFSASSGGNSDVYACNADGSSPRRLTTDPATDGSPSWSPDGRRIAFVSTRSGHPHIYVMNADGSDQRRLTFDGKYNQTPRWSPRGDLVAFTARDERRAFDVFTIALDTGRILRVTQDQGDTNQEPSWAPNGRLLVFASDRAGGSRMVVSTPRGERQTLLPASGELETPAWGPLP